MPELDLATVDHLLTSTRAVRKRLDLARDVPPDVIEECLSLALQAPSGGNAQAWRWLVVTDAATRASLADIYRKGFYPYLEMREAEAAGAAPDATTERVRDSSVYLAQHLHEVPVHVVPCIEGRELAALGNAGGAGVYGSIFPAIWSLQLALRSRGLGSALTTLHLLHEQEAADLLGVPDGYLQVALLPVAYFTGTDFQPASRRPASEVTSWDRWDGPRP